MIKALHMVSVCIKILTRWAKSWPFRMRHFLGCKFGISVWIILVFQNHYMTALVQVKAWLRIGTKASLEPMMTTSQMHLWVNNHTIIFLWFRLIYNGNLGIFKCKKYITYDQYGGILIIIIACLGDKRRQNNFTEILYISTSTLSIP